MTSAIERQLLAMKALAYQTIPEGTPAYFRNQAAQAAKVKEWIGAGGRLRLVKNG